MESAVDADLSLLRTKYETKCLEADALTEQTEKARLEVQSLQQMLKAHGVKDSSLIPAEVRTGELPWDAIKEMKELLIWLAKRVDITHGVVFNVGAEVKAGSRRIFLGRMVNWNLSDAGGQKLSVPHELRTEIAQLLTQARSTEGVEAASDELSKKWDMVSAKISTAGSSSIPAIFLIHNETRQSVVVAAWPPLSGDKEPKKPKNRRVFDPARHFGRPVCEEYRGAPPRPSRPEEAANTTLDTSERAAPSTLERSSGSASVVGLTVAEGDRVEVRYGGQWFTGILQFVDAGNRANVQCDVDIPGLLTIAPLTDVRLTQLVASPVQRRERQLQSPGRS